MNQSERHFILTHRNDDVRKLALKAAPEGVDMQAALQQIAGYQTARRKLPLWAATWDRAADNNLNKQVSPITEQTVSDEAAAQTANDLVLFPPRLSMEQCSSQAAAAYKSQLTHLLTPIKAINNIKAINDIKALNHLTTPTLLFTDLTGGLAVDFSFIAPLFDVATYVERQAHLCQLARHNMAALGIDNACIVEGDAEAILPTLPHQTLIYLDPARRDSAGRKVFLTADCQPDVARLHDQLIAKADIVMIKLSPMLDIHDALRTLPSTRELHIIAVDGEVKELLLILSTSRRCGIPAAPSSTLPTPPTPNTTPATPRIVIPLNLSSAKAPEDDRIEPFTFTYAEEAAATPHYATAIGRYLYEPSPALMKAAAFNTLSARFNLSKLHPNSHLYTSDTLVADFPGRILQVQTVATMREAKRLFCDLDRANIVCRNFPLKPDELRRRLKLKDGGDTFIHATTLTPDTHLLIRTLPISVSK